MASPFRELTEAQIAAINARNRAHRIYRNLDQERPGRKEVYQGSTEVVETQPTHLDSKNRGISEESEPLKFTFPFPPTVNTYWKRSKNGQMHLSSRAIEFRERVTIQMRAAFRAGVIQPTGRLAVLVLVYPPDRRKRDLDNLGKSLLDALQHSGLIRDDADIDDLRFLRRERVPGGKVDVEVKSL